MKNNETKNKKSVRFGILDAVIILVILIAVVGVYFRYSILNVITGAHRMSEYTVSYSIENIRYTTVNYINIGDKVYFADEGDEFGTLINVSENMGAVSYTPSSEYFTKSNGEIVEVMYPNNQSRVDAQGRLNCMGRYSENGGFLVNGSTYIASGQSINVRTDYVTVTIRVEEIALAEENQH